MTDVNIGAHFWSDEHLRDHVTHDPTKGTALTAQILPATTNINTYASFPAPLVGTVTTIYGPWLALVHLAAYVDIATNNVEVALALDLTGATTTPAGSNPEDRLHVTAKSPVGSTLSLSDYATLNVGVTTVELKYAGGPATVSDVALAIIPLRLL
jgi:hypothetical protein